MEAGAKAREAVAALGDARDHHRSLIMCLEAENSQLLAEVRTLRLGGGGGARPPRASVAPGAAAAPLPPPAGRISFVRPRVAGVGALVPPAPPPANPVDKENSVAAVGKSVPLVAGDLAPQECAQQ